MNGGGRPDETAVRAACRMLEGLSGVAVSGELRWVPERGVWALPVRLSVEPGSSLAVPAQTEWFVVIPARYPFGLIEFYPARHGGLAGTHVHQDRNTDRDTSVPWTEGDLCIRSPMFMRGRHGDDPDPLGEAHRLGWYAERARSWLQDAACDRLVQKGDPFELPQFRPVADTVGFCEDEDSFAAWQGSAASWGTAEFVQVNDHTEAVRRFLDEFGRPIVEPAWGALIADAKEITTAGWMRLRAVPCVPPYGAPSSWAELSAAIRSGGEHPERLLRPLLKGLRGGPSGKVLIGFPIPRRVGEPACVMHWQPLQLPTSVLLATASPGFRGNEQGLWARDRMVLSGKGQVDWLNAENWSRTALSSRGRLDARLTGSLITLVGAGSLGAAIAELLVRGGAESLTIVDPERLTTGNLVRHTLGLPDVSHHKAVQLAEHLNRGSPYARVTAEQRSAMPERSPAQTERHGRIVIDCTGSDDVLHLLCTAAPEPGSILFSASLGLGATRLYVLSVPGMTMEFSEFRAAIRPWLRQDLEGYSGPPLPRGGPGCWHPVFPARCDEVWMHAAAAVQAIEQRVCAPGSDWSLSVFQRGADERGGVVYEQASVPSR